MVTHSSRQKPLDKFTVFINPEAEVIMMKLPYGIANFEKIRTEAYFYIDKTHYLSRLEARPESSLILLRSRRFGKSLFCSMLGWYYDRLHADRFEELFSGTYIGAHPTPRRSHYMILSFNFSGINTETLENANQGFYRKVRSSVDLFVSRYHDVFPHDTRQEIVAQPTPNDILDVLFKALSKQGLKQCVYVIIDEYDHFANNILSQGKTMFKDLVKTDGYVRPFYEALKIGTETVVDRIFITGVLPVLLDSLTSGFNIGKNLSTDEAFNEMFGFTEEEMTPILDDLGGAVNREEVRTYYNGYRFSPFAEQRVYNSDMVLYYGTEYCPERGGPPTMIDTNVVSDYRKIRAVLSIGDKAIEEEMLTRIVAGEEIAVNSLTSLFALTQETEFLFDTQALASLLFYMGYLTIAGQQRFGIRLTMPNLVLKSLYLDYMEHLLSRRSQIMIDSRDKFMMWQELLDGKIDQLISLTERLLKGLSNRDYQQFDEKYIKVVMLSLLSDVDIYIPHSEYEVGADGYVDLYLQAAFEPQRSAHYFFELKYVKARATKQTQASKEEEGRRELDTYLNTAAARQIPNLRAYLLVFRKDRCARLVQVV